MYFIEASNHGLNQVPCNLSQALFGAYAGVEDQSRPFATEAEAQAAMSELETSGDWPDGRPVYEVFEVA